MGGTPMLQSLLSAYGGPGRCSGHPVDNRIGWFYAWILASARMTVRGCVYERSSPWRKPGSRILLVAPRLVGFRCALLNLRRPPGSIRHSRAGGNPVSSFFICQDPAFARLSRATAWQAHPDHGLEARATQGLLSAFVSSPSASRGTCNVPLRTDPDVVRAIR